MSPIKIRLAAKTDVGLERTNNEDNFQVASDLSSGQMRWVNNEICSLGDKGTLLVVADGMGGMNAGEVASELAINAVREAFSSDNLTADVMKNRFSIEKFMNTVIINADADIKAYAKKNPESRGMGTTIVIAWLLDNKLYVSWCGDSRAYVYNPQAGLHQISKDHSFVQSLVDKGTIDPEDAFDYPDSNIITRSLGDSSTKAKPESLLKPYELCDNDIILLCTDGLSGMIRDSEMENVIRANEHNMDACADELIRAACAAEGSDNITICMCQILQGAGICNPQVFEEYDKRLAGPAYQKNFVSTVINGGESKGGRRIIILCAVILIILGMAGGGYWHYYGKGKQPKVADTLATDTPKVRKDTISAKVKTVEENVINEPTHKKELLQTHKPSQTVPAPSVGIKDNPKNISSSQETDGDGKNSGDDELTPINGKGQTSPAVGNAPKVGSGEYVVEKGDTYFGLAKKFNTTVEELKKVNNNQELVIGKSILIPKRKKQ